MDEEENNDIQEEVEQQEVADEATESIMPAVHIDTAVAPIIGEMKRAYLNYAMSVIVSRALPDVRDGLKPVHRRVLFAMHKLGLTHKARFSKSAKVVGDVLGKYHPHGDSSVYDALVRMGQLFSMRYPLILGQGNFGSIDGDPPAAMRYTEAKMTAIAEEMLFDIDKDTIKWVDNFDGTLQEPAFLPAKLPNLLLMGAEGIAVGMATKIPPHNLTEVIDAVVRMIDEVTEVKDPAAVSAEEAIADELSHILYTSPLDPNLKQKLIFNTDLQGLMEHVTGPDFPTAASIYGQEEIQRAYATGKGKIIVRATVHREETSKGKEKIVISELPYQVNKANLVIRIADLVRDKKIIGISDLRDESDKDGIRVVVELKRDAVYKKLLNNLYKHTELQTSYPVNMVALVNNTPQTVSLKTILEQYIKHRVRVITNRCLFELDKAKARAHILEGLLIALDHIDEIIAIIKKAKTEADAKVSLMSKFTFSDLQAQAILDMQLKRLTGLERAKLEEELKALRERIAYLEGLLSSVFKLLDVIKTEILEIKEKYGDERRTKVFKNVPGTFTEEQLIENKEVIVTLTQAGYIKQVPRNTYKMQKRGGKGVIGFETKEEDNVKIIQAAMTHDSILYFSNKGKVYQTRVWEIPEGARTSKGKSMVNILPLESGEDITSLLIYNPDDNKTLEKTFIFMCTTKGTVKKTTLSDFKNIRSNGIIALKLTGDDQLLWARMTDGAKKIILATRDGKSIVFKEDDVRPTGRSSQGVRGMNLEKTDAITSMDVYGKEEEDSLLLVLMEHGIGKKTPIKQYPVQKRGGKGVKIASIDNRTGKITFSSMVNITHESLIITARSGQVVKIPLEDIPTLSRAAKGVIVMRFNSKEDAIVSATFL